MLSLAVIFMPEINAYVACVTACPEPRKLSLSIRHQSYLCCFDTEGSFFQGSVEYPQSHTGGSYPTDNFLWGL